MGGCERQVVCNSPYGDSPPRSTAGESTEGWMLRRVRREVGPSIRQHDSLDLWLMEHGEAAKVSASGAYQAGLWTAERRTKLQAAGSL